MKKHLYLKKIQEVQEVFNVQLISTILNHNEVQSEKCDQALAETLFLPGEFYLTLSVICLVNSTLLLNGPEFIQKLASCNPQSCSAKEPQEKLTPQTSRAARD